MDKPILQLLELGFPWQTVDPFLFCAHHDDLYPPGNEALGPDASYFAGRNMGMDFDVRDGFRMYHGEVVPGFPRHPHRGFETITIARRGFIDHSDSLGATARFGRGDVQWMTAGQGIVHSEMFPLVDTEAPNPTELFQIWLNLPRESKLVKPHFTMLWSESIPELRETDAAGQSTAMRVVTGQVGEAKAPPPAPHSWAAREGSDVRILTLEMEPGAVFTLPEGKPGTTRMLYFFRGQSLGLHDRTVSTGVAALLRPEATTTLTNGETKAELLLLEGRPIGEPVAHYGPFVMNSADELRQAFMEYQRTEFGGWPWDRDDPVHPRGRGRFAEHADGTVEERPREG